MVNYRTQFVRIFLTGSVFVFLMGCESDDSVADHPVDMPTPTLTVDSLDMNADSIPDYVFNVSQQETTDEPISVTTIMINSSPQGTNKLGNRSKDSGMAKLDYGATINNDSLFWDSYEHTLAWINWTRIKGWDEEWHGDWVDDSVGYLGVKFAIDSAFHFGWIALQIDSINGDLLINDYQYNPVPDSAIKAGMEP